MCRRWSRTPSPKAGSGEARAFSSSHKYSLYLPQTWVRELGLQVLWGRHFFLLLLFLLLPLALPSPNLQLLSAIADQTVTDNIALKSERSNSIHANSVWSLLAISIWATAYTPGQDNILPGHQYKQLGAFTPLWTSVVLRCQHDTLNMCGKRLFLN